MGIRVHSLEAGARGRRALVMDDVDRRALILRVWERLGPALLAYCVMDTHIHVVAEGWADDVGGALQAALAAYIRGFNRRHGTSGGLLRGPVDDRLITDPFEVGRAIHYVHKNPLRVSAPTVERPIEFRWSSQREFDGLSLAGRANVAGTLEILGPKASTWVHDGLRIEFADAAPATAPAATLDVLLAAAAEVYRQPWSDLLDGSRSPGAVAGRSLFVHLGHLESFTFEQLGAFLGRGRTMAWKLGATPAPVDAVRIARTLVRTPRFRRTLPCVPARATPIGPGSTPRQSEQAVHSGWGSCTKGA